MNIYILKPIKPLHGPWDPWYNCVFGMVVRASSDSAAREIAAEESGAESDWHGNNPWLDNSLTSCEILSPAGDEEVIIKDTWPA